MRALEHEHRLAARERETLEQAGVGMRQREDALRQREETFRRRLHEELERQVREARKQIDEVIAQLKTKTNAIALDAGRRAMTTGDTGHARSDARAAVDHVVSRLLDPVEEPAAASTLSDGRLASVGDRVVVSVLGLEGVVTSVHDQSAEVDVRGKRMRSNVRDLRVVAAAPGTSGIPGTSGTLSSRVRVNVELIPRDTTPTDLNVIGCTVDEALTRAERFLDESLLSDQRTIRLIHGYGTGQLKRALTGFLQQHPLVASIATAPPEQGGGGVTVVELKD
jgi:DNA mismatch repair protein MutS2